MISDLKFLRSVASIGYRHLYGYRQIKHDGREASQGWRQDQNFKVPTVLRYLSADEKCTMVPTEIYEVKLLAPWNIVTNSYGFIFFVEDFR